jgi:hypothetical protein
MQLAAHLCGTRVNEVLAGDHTFVKTLHGLGFRRVQVTAAAAAATAAQVPRHVPLSRSHADHPSQLVELQINATAVNGVDVSNLANQSEQVRAVILAMPEVCGPPPALRAVGSVRLVASSSISDLPL